MTIYAMRPMLTGKSDTDPRVEADSPEAAAKKLAPSHFGDLIPRKVGTPSVNWSVYTRNKSGDAVETRLYIVPAPKAPKAPKPATPKPADKPATPTLDRIAEMPADTMNPLAKFAQIGAARSDMPTADSIAAYVSRHTKAHLQDVIVGLVYALGAPKK